MKIYTQQEMDKHNASFNKQISLYEKQSKAAHELINNLASKVDNRNWIIFLLSAFLAVSVIFSLR